MVRKSAALLAAFVFSQVSAADTAALSWEQPADTIYAVDGSDAGTGTNFYSFSRLIKVSGGTGPIVTLNCQAMSTGAHSLNVAIQMDPQNTYEEDPKERLRLLNINVALTVDGKRQFEKFMMHPKSTKIIPIDKAVGKRIYNAAVTGSSVSIKVQGSTYDLEIPDKDDAFIAFARICPTTNGGTFDNSIFENVQAPT
ncbi:hypothetical protein HHI_16165 [Hyphomonas hirschiana VP5]|uniref:Lipoprotein n=1 Tax=Hyphomonas hirschiana VP5 TaxID=1280951 RepID=A0A059F9K5_9PROT|nr:MULTISPECIES: hypothetical protein [Hyphomonas]KCZ87294.1 hypothetical protein HHI_16165 [Hyphomonas hirschiana VP5]